MFVYVPKAIIKIPTKVIMWTFTVPFTSEEIRDFHESIFKFTISVLTDFQLKKINKLLQLNVHSSSRCFKILKNVKQERMRSLRSREILKETTVDTFLSQVS